MAQWLAMIEHERESADAFGYPLGEHSERAAAGLFWTLLPDGSMWNGSRQRR
jgi:hypothetical protein